MNTALFYDTETSGLPIFSAPSEDPGQPHIVQLAAALVDLDTRETLASLDVIVRPDGWEIPDAVAAVHGITTERAAALGVPESLALSLFLEMWAACRVRIAHNEQFDARIIRIAQHRAGELESDLEEWKAGAAECTARLATPIVKCPPHGEDDCRRAQPLQDRQPERGGVALHRQAVRERAQRHGRRERLHGRVLCHPGSAGGGGGLI